MKNSGFTTWCFLLLMPLLGGGAAVHAQSLPPQPSRRVTLDVTQLRQQLAPVAGASARLREAATYRISLPTWAGARTFRLRESSVLPMADAAAQRRLRTFVGYEEGAPAHQVSLVLTPGQVLADVLAGSKSTSLQRAADGQGYLLQQTTPSTGPCGVSEEPGSANKAANFSTMPEPFSFGTQLRRIRYALLLTKEYYTTNGGTDAAVELAVVRTMNQMSALYGQEMSVSFELVKPTGGSYYFSAMTTPTLSGSAPATAGSVRDQNLNEVYSLIRSRYASGTYDLGHCFHNSGGGLAYVDVICNGFQGAGAWSGVTTSGFQQVLAHEIGHQHGAKHAFNGPCGTPSLGSNLEPGGGATIMAYASVCGSQNLQGLASGDINHFSTKSLREMRNGLLRASCPTVLPNSNQPPTLDAGADYVIPCNTPFTLTARGTDPDGDVLAYTWNQFDYSPNRNALGTLAGRDGIAAVDDPESPLFRPRPPRTTPSRTFPDLQYVLSNANKPANRIGEALSNVGRDIHFVVTARDQRAGAGTYTTDNVTLTVAPNTGPFAMTSPNTDVRWVAGQRTTVQWAVNGTDLAPIGVSQVRLTLSTDGGQTFPTVLATTPNDGSYALTVPNVTTTQARIRVEAVGNIFFDISDVDFEIGSCAPVATQILPDTALSANAGAPALALTQNPYGFTQLTGANQLRDTITSADPTTPLTYYRNGSCQSYSNTTYYHAYRFVPTTTDRYTVTANTRFTNMVMRLYAGSFNPGNPCSNMLADNYLTSKVSAPLTAGQTYVVVVSTFDYKVPALASYALTFAGTTAEATAYVPLQNADYDYQYAVVNAATNAVVQLAPTADLRTLPAGTYNVLGLLLQRGYDTSTLATGTLSDLRAALSSAGLCGQLSNNQRRVTITGGPLPVMLATFTGQTAGAANQLQWQTASEHDVAYFEVQRSLDGTTFAPLGQIPAANKTTAHSYTFPDLTPPTGRAYYRLRMQDQAGPAAFSPAVLVQRTETALSGLQAQAFPNPVPVGASLQLQLQTPDAQRVEVTVRDVVGRTVWRQSVALPVGSTQLSFPGSSGWHGVYLLTVQPAAGPSLHQKVVLQ